MAKYKLKKEVANSKSFRFGGVKYETRIVSQKQLKSLHDNECHFVVEEKAKAPKAPKPSKKKSNEEEETTGSDDQ